MKPVNINALNEKKELTRAQGHRDQVNSLSVERSEISLAISELKEQQKLISRSGATKPRQNNLQLNTEDKK